MKKTIGVRFGIYSLLTIALMASTFTLGDTIFANDSSSEIFENISYDKSSLRFVETLDDFETVTSNPDVFLEDAEDGRVKMKLPGKEFDLELEETHVMRDDAKVLIENETGIYTIPAAKINTYRGKVVGEENSSAGFAVSNDIIIGQIEVENICYAIEATNKTVDGKVVLVVYSSDNIKEIENPEFAYCGVEETNSSVTGGENAMNLDNSRNKGSKLLNENSSNVNNSSRGRSGVISSTPGFELFGSFTSLYIGWRLRRKE